MSSMKSSQHSETRPKHPAVLAPPAPPPIPPPAPRRAQQETPVTPGADGAKKVAKAPSFTQRKRQEKAEDQRWKKPDMNLVQYMSQLKQEYILRQNERDSRVKDTDDIEQQLTRAREQAESEELMEQGGYTQQEVKVEQAAEPPTESRPRHVTKEPERNLKSLIPLRSPPKHPVTTGQSRSTSGNPNRGLKGKQPGSSNENSLSILKMLKMSENGEKAPSNLHATFSEDYVAHEEQQVQAAKRRLSLSSFRSENATPQATGRAVSMRNLEEYGANQSSETKRPKVSFLSGSEAVQQIKSAARNANTGVHKSEPAHNDKWNRADDVKEENKEHPQTDAAARTGVAGPQQQKSKPSPQRGMDDSKRDHKFFGARFTAQRKLAFDNHFNPDDKNAGRPRWARSPETHSNKKGTPDQTSKLQKTPYGNTVMKIPGSKQTSPNTVQKTLELRQLLQSGKMLARTQPKPQAPPASKDVKKSPSSKLRKEGSPKLNTQIRSLARALKEPEPPATPKPQKKATSPTKSTAAKPAGATKANTHPLNEQNLFSKGAKRFQQVPSRSPSLPRSTSHRPYQNIFSRQTTKTNSPVSKSPSPLQTDATSHKPVKKSSQQSPPSFSFRQHRKTEEPSQQTSLKSSPKPSPELDKKQLMPWLSADADKPSRYRNDKRASSPSKTQKDSPKHEFADIGCVPVKLVPHDISLSATDEASEKLQYVPLNIWSKSCSDSLTEVSSHELHRAQPEDVHSADVIKCDLKHHVLVARKHMHKHSKVARNVDPGDSVIDLKDAKKCSPAKSRAVVERRRGSKVKVKRHHSHRRERKHRSRPHQKAYCLVDSSERRRKRETKHRHLNGRPKHVVHHSRHKRSHRSKHGTHGAKPCNRYHCCYHDAKVHKKKDISHHTSKRKSVVKKRIRCPSHSSDESNTSSTSYDDTDYEYSIGSSISESDCSFDADSSTECFESSASSNDNYKMSKRCQEPPKVTWNMSESNVLVHSSDHTSAKNKTGKQAGVPQYQRSQTSRDFNEKDEQASRQQPTAQDRRKRACRIPRPMRTSASASPPKPATADQPPEGNRTFTLKSNSLKEQVINSAEFCQDEGREVEVIEQEMNEVLAKLYRSQQKIVQQVVHITSDVQELTARQAAIASRSARKPVSVATMVPEIEPVRGKWEGDTFDYLMMLGFMVAQFILQYILLKS